MCETGSHPTALSVTSGATTAATGGDDGGGGCSITATDGGGGGVAGDVAGKVNECTESSSDDDESANINLGNGNGRGICENKFATRITSSSSACGGDWGISVAAAHGGDDDGVMGDAARTGDDACSGEAGERTGDTGVGTDAWLVATWTLGGGGETGDGFADIAPGSDLVATGEEVELVALDGSATETMVRFLTTGVVLGAGESGKPTRSIGDDDEARFVGGELVSGDGERLHGESGTGCSSFCLVERRTANAVNTAKRGLLRDHHCVELRRCDGDCSCAARSSEWRRMKSAVR